MIQLFQRLIPKRKSPLFRWAFLFMAEPSNLTTYTKFEIDKWPFSPAFQDFADFLGLSPDKDSRGINWRYDKKTADKMQKIYVWGMIKAKTNDHEKIKEIVYNLQRKIGTNWEGKTLIDRLWQHTMFDAQFKKEVEKLYEQIETKEEEKKEEPIKVERPEKGIPAKVKPLKKIEKVERAMRNEMEIKQSPVKESKPIPIEI